MDVPDQPHNDEEAPPPCEHIGFEASVDVARLTDVEQGPVTGYRASVTVRCAMCQEPFVFVGAPLGVSQREPRVSPTGKELRAPIRPWSAPDGWGEDAPGVDVRFTVGAATDGTASRDGEGGRAVTADGPLGDAPSPSPLPARSPE